MVKCSQFIQVTKKLEFLVFKMENYYIGWTNQERTLRNYKLINSSISKIQCKFKKLWQFKNKFNQIYLIK